MKLFATVEPDSYTFQRETLLLYISKKPNDNYLDLLVDLRKSVEHETSYRKYFIYLGDNSTQIYDNDLNLTQFTQNDIESL
jgi:hypothetical protein